MEASCLAIGKVRMDAEAVANDVRRVGRGDRCPALGKVRVEARRTGTPCTLSHSWHSVLRLRCAQPGEIVDGGKGAR